MAKITREKWYTLAEGAQGRKVTITKQDLNESFKYNVLTGEVHWGDRKEVVSQRWLDQILKSLGITDKKKLGTLKGNLSKEVEFIVPPKGEGAASAIGNYFEYLFWQACQKLLTGSEASIENSKEGKQKIMHWTFYKDNVTVNSQASSSFVQRPDWEIIKTLIKNSPNTVTILQQGAIEAAEMYLNSIQEKISNSPNKTFTVNIEATRDSETKGDIILEVLDAMGNPVEDIKPPLIELKTYKQSTISYFNLVDDAENFKLRFSQFLYDNRGTLWAQRADEYKKTSTWVDHIQQEGLRKYLRANIDLWGENNFKEDEAMLRFLLAKGEGNEILKDKIIVVVRRLNNRPVVTISFDLDKIVRDIGDISATQEKKVVKFSSILDKKRYDLGTFKVADESQFDRESVYSRNQTPGPGPDWKTTFNFVLNKAFYGFGQS